MNTVFGIFLGAILTYFFNVLTKRNEAQSLYEEQYVIKVCVPIVGYLKDSSSLGVEDIIKYIDSIYTDNLICIGKKDQAILDALKNSTCEKIAEVYSDLQKHFQGPIDRYKKKINGEHFISRDFTNITKAIAGIIGIVGVGLFSIGIAGALGVYAWNFSLFSWDVDEILSIGLCFEDALEVIRFIVFGVMLVVISVFLSTKLIKWLHKNKIK